MKKIKDVFVRVPMTEKGHKYLKIVSINKKESIGELIVDTLLKIGINVQQ